MPDPTREELLVAAALERLGMDALLLNLRLSASELDASLNSTAHHIAHAASSSLRETLLSRARALLGDGWQPIETAPKDGTTIQLWSKYMSEPCTGAWGAQSHGRLGWNAKHDGMWVVESEHDLSGTTYKEIAVATHWRHLPTPPSEKSNADKESGT